MDAVRRGEIAADQAQLVATLEVRDSLIRLEETIRLVAAGEPVEED